MPRNKPGPSAGAAESPGTDPDRSLAAAPGATHLQDSVLAGAVVSGSKEPGFSLQSAAIPIMETRLELRADQGLISPQDVGLLVNVGVSRICGATLPSYVEQGYLQTGLQGMYRISIALDVTKIDPYFTEAARVWGALIPGDRGGDTSLVIGNGSDLVQLLADRETGEVPVATMINGQAFINTVMPFAPLGSPEFIDHILFMTQRQPMTVAGFGRRAETVTVQSAVDPESGRDLAVMSDALLEGEHLVSGNPSIMVPLKTTALLVLSSDGQKAHLHFRRPEDFADYLAGVLSLPEVDKTSGSEWIAQLSESSRAEFGARGVEVVESLLKSSLDYSALVASRGAAAGWRMDPDSAKMLREMAAWLSPELRAAVRESVTRKLSSDPAGQAVAPAILRQLGLEPV